ncbi:hypothetical protein ABVT39_003627 [Epinephelus coioides]
MEFGDVKVYENTQPEPLCGGPLRCCIPTSVKLSMQSGCWRLLYNQSSVPEYSSGMVQSVKASTRQPGARYPGNEKQCAPQDHPWGNPQESSGRTLTVWRGEEGLPRGYWSVSLVILLSKLRSAWCGGG